MHIIMYIQVHNFSQNTLKVFLFFILGNFGLINFTRAYVKFYINMNETPSILYSFAAMYYEYLQIEVSKYEIMNATEWCIQEAFIEKSGNYSDQNENALDEFDENEGDGEWNISVKNPDTSNNFGDGTSKTKVDQKNTPIITLEKKTKTKEDGNFVVQHPEKSTASDDHERKLKESSRTKFNLPMRSSSLNDLDQNISKPKEAQVDHPKSSTEKKNKKEEDARPMDHPPGELNSTDDDDAYQSILIPKIIRTKSPKRTLGKEEISRSTLKSPSERYSSVNSDQSISKPKIAQVDHPKISTEKKNKKEEDARLMDHPPGELNSPYDSRRSTSVINGDHGGSTEKKEDENDIFDYLQFEGDSEDLDRID
ncbi:Hypothetical protein CINCED_3A015052 [Cinara cedri]|uniref:Uncharacterized protein n=1 Tax=Cinara cedri TaxID=506608 RepID=A0A5E4NHJ0_9HEMI|nr:Hypothetical protein CINCED_3A015052 [Cinara cedri]